MRTVYHEFESLEHLLGHRLLPGGGGMPIRLVVFGGTGAVGGASVLELCRMILMSKRLRPVAFTGEIYATGIADKDISNFASRLYLALGDEVEIEKIEPLRHYRLDGRIDLKFSLLRLQAPGDLSDLVAAGKEPSTDELEAALSEHFAAQACPFQGFVEGLGSDLLHAVLPTRLPREQFYAKFAAQSDACWPSVRKGTLPAVLRRPEFFLRTIPGIARWINKRRYFKTVARDPGAPLRDEVGKIPAHITVDDAPRTVRVQPDDAGASARTPAPALVQLRVALPPSE